MKNIVMSTIVDLDAVLLVISILAVTAIGILLVMLLIKLNRAASRFNEILKNKQRDIERTLGNLPDMTKNISGAAEKIKDVASSVENVTGKVESVVSTVSPGNIFKRIPMIIETAKRTFENVTMYFSKMKNAKNEDQEDIEDIEIEEY